MSVVDFGLRVMLTSVEPKVLGVFERVLMLKILIFDDPGECRPVLLTWRTSEWG